MFTRPTLSAFLFLLLPLAKPTPLFAAEINPWSRAKAPVTGTAEAIGGYTAGCLTGAEEFPKSSRGHEVMRARRSRHYGHPVLLAYLRDLATFAGEKLGGKVLIGDLALARGGPTMSKHISHQTGLDADIWFWLLPAGRKMRDRDREALHSPSVVNAKTRELNSQWRPYMGELLRFTAERPEVDRILVNPAIKRALCRTTTENRAWLAKLRPWWGHADHMHVRFACPAGSPDCEAQPAVTEGEDCGASLDWWWSKEAEEEFKKMQVRIENPVMPVLPKRCETLIGTP